jgi:hypothetical protein
MGFGDFDNTWTEDVILGSHCFLAFLLSGIVT